METTGSLFRWTERYSVHIAHLDRQHQAVFAAADEFNQAMAAGKGNEALLTILDKLLDYALTHFAAEESLMKEYAVPGFSAHCAEHEMFRQKAAAFLADYKSGKQCVPVTLMFFIQDWLKKHVLGIDKQYSEFLNARGVR